MSIIRKVAMSARALPGCYESIVGVLSEYRMSIEQISKRGKITLETPRQGHGSRGSFGARISTLFPGPTFLGWWGPGAKGWVELF